MQYLVWVLQTIPWDKVDIEVISVETHLAGVVMEGSREDIIDFMKKQGYRHRQHTSGTNFAHYISFKDDLFIREDVAQKLATMRFEAFASI